MPDIDSLLSLHCNNAREWRKQKFNTYNRYEDGQSQRSERTEAGEENTGNSVKNDEIQYTRIIQFNTICQEKQQQQQQNK